MEVSDLSSKDGGGVGEEGREGFNMDGCEKNTQAHTPAIQIILK